MGKKYFINPVPTTSGKYTIHKDGCPLMPGGGRKICIGRFHSLSEVKEKWKGLHKVLAFCPFCLKAHESASLKATADAEAGPGKASFSMIKHSLMNTFFCSVS